jgi:hypothetical protein
MDVAIAVPDTDLDGAVVELWRDEDGNWYAEVRIPAPAD